MRTNRAQTLFAAAVSTLLAADYPGTSYTDVFELETDTPYYYVVRAVDVVSGVSDDNLVEVAGIPKGTFTSATWIDDGGDTGQAKMIMESPWSLSATEGNLEPGAYKTGAYGNGLCSGLETPELKLGTGSVLTFASKYSIENGWDKGEVQISTDGGSVWERVETDYPGSSSQASDACGLPPGDYFTGASGFYAFHTADLTSWNDEFVKIRFALSTNDSGIGAGWWIDDIDITNVDVPGSCVTGSTCADNPYVDVTPEGPFATCEGQAETLTAGLTGGNGPFLYQWTRDGIDIAGAESSTLDVNDGGTHLYNVKVRAQACGEETTDGNSTEITWTGVPAFDGIASAINAQLPTCTVELAWWPASTVCPGPITYDVYRSTASPVAVTPTNRIAWNLTDTSHADSLGLTGGVTYHYLVRAVEESTGQQDTNTIEASAVPTGQGGSFCATVQPPPAPAPDGEGNTSPLTGSRATIAGDVIDVTWDAASCPAPTYNLLFGDLADLSSYDLSGARCSIGATGNYTWSGVPGGDLYFLIVGSSGQGTESSWGTDSDLNERNGAAASGYCLVMTKNTALTCP